MMTKCLALLPVSPELKGTINQLHIFKKLLPSQFRAINDSYRSGQNCGLKCRRFQFRAMPFLASQRAIEPERVLFKTNVIKGRMTGVRRGSSSFHKRCFLASRILLSFSLPQSDNCRVPRRGNHPSTGDICLPKELRRQLL